MPHCWHNFFYQAKKAHAVPLLPYCTFFLRDRRQKVNHKRYIHRSKTSICKKERKERITGKWESERVYAHNCRISRADDCGWLLRGTFTFHSPAYFFFNTKMMGLSRSRIFFDDSVRRRGGRKLKGTFLATSASHPCRYNNPGGARVCRLCLQ